MTGVAYKLVDRAEWTAALRDSAPDLSAMGFDPA